MVLQVGFYLIGIGLAAALLALPVVQLRYQEQVTIPGFVAIWVGLWLIWALIPPIHRHVETGPSLTRDAYPSLHRVIDETSMAIGVRAPDEVFLFDQANALVAARGRWIWRRRELTLGLPLFDMMTIDQLRGIIAHELGHLHHGDLRLGPWVYGTRQAILTTLKRMDQDGVGLHLLFHWYGRLYVRVSQAVSRQQEHHADRIAARITGRPTYVDALRTLDRTAQHWAAYWHHDCLPVLERGFRPPLLEGFDAFCSGPLAQTDEKEESVVHSDPSEDSHPSLGEREAALGIDESHQMPDTNMAPAKELLPNLDAAEAALIRFHAVDYAEFPTIGWHEVGQRVWIERWHEELTPYRAALSELDAPEIATAVADIEFWSHRLRRCGPAILSPEASRRRTQALISMWFCLLLHNRGWTCRLDPGHPVAFHKNHHTINPFDLIDQLSKDEFSREEWRILCGEFGL